MAAGVDAGVEEAFVGVDGLVDVGPCGLEGLIRGLEDAEVEDGWADFADLVHVEGWAGGGRGCDGAGVGWLASALGVEDGGGCGEDVW